MSDNLFNKQTAFTLSGFNAGTVTDQGDRGTCVAVSVIKALEYAIASGEKFSPQYLYACCKKKSDNSNTPGLTLHNAFSCVKEYGIALNNDCPYNKAQIDDEAQIDADRLCEVKTRPFEYSFKTLLTPQNVNEYKMILSGLSGLKPVPVVTGIRFFDNLMPDGTINVPGSFDHELHAHAIVIYGWKDTPDDPSSRGYFLAQNSWGSIPQLKIKYEYMEQFAMEAGYTEIPAQKQEVITVKEDTVTAVDKKAAANVAASILPDQALAAENDFFGLQKQNMLSDRFSYPDIRSPFQFWEKASQYVPEDSFLNPLGDAPVSFAEFLKERQVHHLICRNVKVYRVMVKNGKFYNVVTTFFTRTDDQKISAGDLGLFYDYMETYGPNDQALHTFMTIGGYPGFDPTCQPLSNPTVILCERKELTLLFDDPYYIWQMKCPNTPWNMFTYDFILHLLPNSYNGAVKALLDTWSKYQPASVKEIKKKLLLPSQSTDIHDKIIEAEVDRLFLTEYPRFGKNKQGGIEIREKTNLQFKPSKRFIKSTRQLKYEVIIGTAVKSLLPVIMFALMDLLTSEKFSNYQLSVKFLKEAFDNYVNYFGGLTNFWIYFSTKCVLLALLWILGSINTRKRLKLEYNIK